MSARTVLPYLPAVKRSGLNSPRIWRPNQRGRYLAKPGNGGTAMGQPFGGKYMLHELLGLGAMGKVFGVSCASRACP